MTARLRIGLIEDTEHDVFAFRRAFARVGDIQHWHDGETFRDAIASDLELLDGLDLLLVDLNLPGIDGVGIARAVRAHPSGQRLPLVMLTGSHAEHDIIRALDAAVTEYEVKPDDTGGLGPLVERCTALARAVREV